MSTVDFETKAETRYKNLRKLMEFKQWRCTDIANAAGRTQAQISMYLSDTPHRDIGKVLARKLEKELNIPEGILDQPNGINTLPSIKKRVEGDHVREMREKLHALQKHVEELERSYNESLNQIISDTLFSFNIMNEYLSDNIFSIQIDSKSYKTRSIILEYKKGSKISVTPDIEAFLVVHINERDQVDNLRFAPRYQEPLNFDQVPGEIDVYSYWRSEDQDSIIEKYVIKNDLGFNNSKLEWMEAAGTKAN